VFARVNDLREFNTWNPFAAADPSAKIDCCGPSRGPGAAYEFSFVSEGATTNVTWAMTGTCGFVHKLCGLVFNSDKMVGGEFAKGLASLKNLVEAEGAAAA
jgi:hypothetical protein